MSKLVIVVASATLLLAGGAMWKANAATITDAGSLGPLAKTYTAVEKVAYWRRHYRRGYGYRYPYYGYGYRPYYGYGYYRPYGYYGYGWRPGITIGIGPRWGWGWGY
jgi:hypothetical protein